MKLIKYGQCYILRGFNELCNYELEADVLNCFLSNNSKLLFGCKWRVIDLDNIGNEEMNEITKKMYIELVPFMIQDERNDKRIDDDKLFIDERTVFINNEWPFPWPAPNKEVLDTIWFCPRDKSEIIKSMKIDEFFNCIVLVENCEFNDFSYAIGLSEDDDGTSIAILVKNEEEFINIIVPKLQKLIGNLVDEINE